MYIELEVRSLVKIRVIYRGGRVSGSGVRNDLINIFTCIYGAPDVDSITLNILANLWSTPYRSIEIPCRNFYIHGFLIGKLLIVWG